MQSYKCQPQHINSIVVTEQLFAFLAGSAAEVTRPTGAYEAHPNSGRAWYDTIIIAVRFTAAVCVRGRVLWCVCVCASAVWVRGESC
jgi:hypothetical protein